MTSPRGDAVAGGTLVLVATPIGNLSDLPPRAVDVLASVELICCEDTRRTGRLLAHAGLSGKRLAVANEHTEAQRVDDVVAVLGTGADVALVTDAGTPGISDPGERLVRAVLDAGFEVSTVPGPAAFVAALVASGLPTSRFVFEGFLPRSGAARRGRLSTIAAEDRTVVLYEAPHRIERTLADLRDVCGPQRQAAIARELTKLYEQFVRGTLGDIDVGTPRGEYVVVIGPRAAAPEASADDLRDAVDAAMMRGASTRQAAAEVAAALGVSKRDAYEVALERRTARRNADQPPSPATTNGV